MSFLARLYVPSEFKDGRWPSATKEAVFKIFQAVERSENAPKTVTDWDVLAQAWCHTAGCRVAENMNSDQRIEANLARLYILKICNLSLYFEFREYALDVHGLPSGPAVRIFLYRILKAVNAQKGVPRGTTFPAGTRVPEFVVLQTGNRKFLSKIWSKF